LRLLIARAPEWVVIERETRDDVRLSAQAVQGSGKKGRQYRLRLSLGRKGQVEIREYQPDLLPSFCPERHINEDASFCLGYEAGSQVIDGESAGQWWEKLRSFQLCQDTATNTGHWPDYAALAHGDAGFFQMVGETAAGQLDKLDDFKSAMHGVAWVSDNVWQVTDDGKRLLNGRMPCLCGRIGRRGRPKLRKECREADEPCLVILEAQRRDAEEDFWRTKKGKPCCGTMVNCPLDPKWQPLPDRRALRRAGHCPRP
jgi:hypothetical protein